MLLNRAIAVVILLLLSRPLLAQRGWQPGTSGRLRPERYITLTSRERNAVLQVTCVPKGDIGDGLWVSLDMHIPGTFFDFHGDYSVFLDARFLPDTTVQSLHGQSHAGSGYPNTVTLAGLLNVDQPRDSSGPQQIVARLARTKTWQVELATHGRGHPMATFSIPNNDVLNRFVADCPEH